MPVAADYLGLGTAWDLNLAEPGDLDRLQKRWRELEERSDCSFFQSWSWIGTWLDSLPAGKRPIILEARRHGRLVGLAALGRRKLRRRLFTSRALLLSETGHPSYDRLTIEHNGFLLERGLEVDILQQCLRFLATDPIAWDEIVVSGLEADRAQTYAEITRGSVLDFRTRLSEPYFYIQLEPLRRAGANYLSSLSANTRHQIRRALRGYAKRGPVSITHARDVITAQEFFVDMRELHQHHWNSRGESGAFSSAYMNNFHQRLIETCVPRDEIELVRLSAGRERLGYLYQFVFRGVISCYQGGFSYESDAHLKPGLIAHALCIEQMVRRGMHLYDFLMGNQRYKHSLASHRGQMRSVVLQKKGGRLELEKKLDLFLRRARTLCDRVDRK